MPCFYLKSEKRRRMPKLAILSKFSPGGTLFMEIRDQKGKGEEWCHETLAPKSQENEDDLAEF